MTHITADHGMTSLCGKAEKPFDFFRAGDVTIEQVDCQECIEIQTRSRNTYVSADPRALQSVKIRLVDAGGRDVFELACNTGEYELAATTDMGLEDGRETIRFELIAKRRVSTAG